MISPKIAQAINAQINAELYSSYLYLSMSAFMDAKNFKGFAKWLRLQHDEERAHALKLLDHLIARGGEGKLGAIAAPPVEFGAPLAVFEAVQKHEAEVTASIHRLYALALEEKDYASQVFLQWFVSEQVEEEEHAAELVERVRMVGQSTGGLLQIDKEAGKRAAG